RLGPVTVTRSSLFSLRLFVGGIALINVILVSVILAFWAQLRRARGEIDALRSATEAARDAQ
ncbi:MAG TPA: hypothetical protein PKD61_39455, partial [Polyangiaceae bacterium]|nr:hypothetical protein [Polyangiaceae bacterium]